MTKALAATHKIRTQIHYPAALVGTVTSGEQGSLTFTHRGMVNYVNMATTLAAETVTQVIPADWTWDIANFRSELYIRNSTTNGLHVTRYKIYCKTDTSSLAGAATVSYYTPPLAWTTAALTSRGDTTATAPERWIGNTPYEASDFLTYYGISKVQTFFLKPGQGKKYVRNYRNYKFSHQHAETSTNVNHGGHTEYDMFVYYGQIASYTAGAGASFSLGRLIGQQIHKIKIRNSSDILSDRQFVSKIGALPTTAPAAVLTAITAVAPVVTY